MNSNAPTYMAASDTEPAWKPKPYTQEQADQIKLLMAERHITAAMLFREFPARPADYTDGVKVINWLANIALPAPSPQVPALPVNVDKNGKPLATRYALRDEDGTVKFYRVKAGRKPGFYFLDVQASDDTYPIKSYERKQAILGRIAADPKAALALYGQEIGACGRCGRTLTSEYRKLGIGPVCIDK